MADRRMLSIVKDKDRISKERPGEVGFPVEGWGSAPWGGGSSEMRIHLDFERMQLLDVCLFCSMVRLLAQQWHALPSSD